jgi:dienelactone hydrolase
MRSSTHWSSREAWQAGCDRDIDTVAGGAGRSSGVIEMSKIAGCLALVVMVVTGCAGQAPMRPAISGEFAKTIVPPDHRAGFDFPYILRSPSHFDASAASYLPVEANNSGHPTISPAQDMADAEELSNRGMGAAVSRILELPLLMPVFPRPTTQYTASLDRQSVARTELPLGRIDRQVVAMICDARTRLAKLGIATHSKVFMVGFSASGHFANRFTMLHPTLVQGAVAAGVNGTLMLPLADVGGAELRYPLGVKDVAEITGKPFDFAAWRRVPQFIFMGAEDTNDWAVGDDVYDNAQRQLVFTHLGKRMLPERWERTQFYYHDSGANVTFETYAGIGHGTNGKIHSDVASFIRQHE